MSHQILPPGAYFPVEETQLGHSCVLSALKMEEEGQVR